MILPGSHEWHAERAKRLTASQFGAALGLHPYCSPQKLWRIKLGLETVDTNHHMQRGMDNELQALYDYQVETGHWVDKAGLLVHPAHDWLACTPDGLVGDRGLVEVKAPIKIRAEVPEYHLAQVQGQLEIADRDWCDYVQWKGAEEAGFIVVGELRIVRTARDREWWERAFPVLKKFWSFVQSMEPPPRGFANRERESREK